MSNVIFQEFKRIISIAIQVEETEKVGTQFE